MEQFTHIPKWLDDTECLSLYAAADKMGLMQHIVRIHGKEILQPRLTAWCCDTGEGYGYSGQITPATPWPKEFIPIRERLKSELGRDFPSVLVNKYRDGQDSVSWHKDDEGIFGPDLIIATLSLGGTRKFQVKNVKSKERVSFVLENGDLLIMQNGANDDWVHCVPKTGQQVEPRISLTFRTINK